MTMSLSRTVSEINGDFCGKLQILPARVTDAPADRVTLGVVECGTVHEARMMSLPDCQKV